MKDFNNDKNTFNKSVKKKFDAARIEPSDGVWEGIEGTLLKHENVKMQKRAVFYRNVAAAVLLIAAVSIYFNVQDAFNGSLQNTEVVDLTSIENSIDNGSPFSNYPDAISRPEVIRDEKSFNRNTKSAEEAVRNAIADPSKERSANDELTATSDADEKGSKTEAYQASNQLAGNNFDETNQQSLMQAFADNTETDKKFLRNELEKSQDYIENTIASHTSEIEKVESINPASSQFEDVQMPKTKVSEVSYFAVSNLDQVKSSNGLAFQSALNVGSGSFNPNANIASGAPQPGFAALNTPGTAGRTSGNPDLQNQHSAERQLVDDLSNAPIRSNISITFGVQFGVHLNDRLKIGTGLQYGNYRSSTESNAVIRDINSDEIFPYHGASNATELADGKIVNITSEYDVYNDFKILSVPLVVSYKFIDRKFGVGLMAGATADIMLRNTIRGGDDQISEISFENYENQSYKNLFYSGVAGVEFSYNLSKNYSLSLTPTYKKAFMNITNDDASFNSAPDFLSVDMSLQFTF